MPAEVIRWNNGVVEYIDQTLLPFEVKIVSTSDYRSLITALQSLAIRGAPLIGIAAAYGVTLAAEHYFKTASDGTIREMKTHLLSVCDAFASSRPTAVNLFWALDKARGLVHDASDPRMLRDALLTLALSIHEDDKHRCELIRKHGASLFSGGGNFITHCNAGALATGGEGTALNVFFELHRTGKSVHVYVDETRPLLQGARLTTWELQQRGIPFTLITDSTAAFVMQRQSITAVIVGADRIASNGDTANKIGTYSLALAARAHEIPLYVAAPTSTIDLHINDGSKIPIEERSSEEVLLLRGTRVAPEKTSVYAPAFDVTPFRYITAFITDKGILRSTSSVAGFKDTFLSVL